MTGDDQPTNGRLLKIVEAEADRNLIALDRRLAARESNERLAAPAGHVEPLAVFRDLDAVRTGRFAAWHDLPPCRGVPLPELAVFLAGLHVGASARGASRLKIRRRKAAFRQRNDRVQARSEEHTSELQS